MLYPPTLVNNRDNCPHVSNPDQADTDGNGVGDACEGCKFVWNTETVFDNSYSLFFNVAAVLGLESTFVKVNEDAEEAQFCLVIEHPINDCPLSFSFVVYISTINGTAGMYEFVSYTQ